MKAALWIIAAVCIGFSETLPLPYGLDDLILGDFWEGLTPADVKTLSEAATADTNKNPNIRSQYVVCTQINDGVEHVHMRRKLLEDTLQCFSQAVVVDKSKQRACYTVMTLPTKVTELESLKFFWQASQPFMKINKKLSAVVESKLSDVDTNGRYLTVTYLNNSQYGVPESLEDEMTLHLVSLKEILSSSLDLRPADSGLGKWSQVRRLVSDVTCTK